MAIPRRVLLIVSGGIAAYKALDLVRLLRDDGIAVRCILTRNGAQFVTALSLETLSEDTVYQNLFSLTGNNEIGHIELSRDADLLVVAPATANIIAKMRVGFADDLASTALLATDKPILIAPAMNVRMWEHQATQENINVLRTRGINVIDPEEGNMACGEYGLGRMAEANVIASSIKKLLKKKPENKPYPNHGLKTLLTGKKAIVTSGPTHEPLDPVRFIANRSSGQQGHAIAAALADHGANTVLISGPTNLSNPKGVSVHKVDSALEMLAACKKQLPADILVCAAAVADWRIRQPAKEKIKKNGVMPKLELTENPDILATISKLNKRRPELVIGFAAETSSIIDRARDKLINKKCDWIVANDVSDGTEVFGSKENTVHIIDENGIENWPKMSKEMIGKRLAHRIADFLIAV